MVQDILSFIKSHENRVEPLARDYNQKYWDLSLTGSGDRAQALVESKAKYLEVYSNKADFQKLQQWRERTADLSPIAARQFRLIYDSYVPYQMEESVLRDMVERETEIENLFNTFRADFESGKASDNELREVLRTEKDIARRKCAWEASKQVGAAVSTKLLELVRLRNREARKLGYRDYYGMMFELQELDENTVLSLFDRLAGLSDPAFSAMKTELDTTLKKAYGSPDSPAYPWLYADPFFQEYPAAGNSGESLDDVFKNRDIEALTKAHYTSIGLDIRNLLVRADLYERDGKSQHAFCLDVDREGDVRVLCNVRQNERWMSTMLHEFGHAVYDRDHDPNLPFTLRTPAHIFTTEAIAMLNGRMSKDPHWLSAIAGVSSEDAKRLSANATRTLRSEMLIFLRWAITLVKFERELYRDPEQNLNRLWWEYVERYQKVIPPPARDLADWAAKIHLATAPTYYQNYVLGELMASQLLNHIHTQLVPDGTYAGNVAVGSYLKEKVFQPGASLEWNRMLRQATGEELNPAHFIRQFVD